MIYFEGSGRKLKEAFAGVCYLGMALHDLVAKDEDWKHSNGVFRERRYHHIVEKNYRTG